MRVCEYCGCEAEGREKTCTQCGGPMTTAFVPPPPPKPKSVEYDVDEELEEKPKRMFSFWKALFLTIIFAGVGVAIFIGLVYLSTFSSRSGDFSVSKPTPQIVFPGVSEEQMPEVARETWPSIKGLPTNAMNFSEFTLYDQQRIIACNWIRDRNDFSAQYDQFGQTFVSKHPTALVMNNDVGLGVNVRAEPSMSSEILYVLSKDVRIKNIAGEWSYYPQRIRITDGVDGWLQFYIGYDTNYQLNIMGGWVNGSNLRMPTDQDYDYSEWMCY